MFRSHVRRIVGVPSPHRACRERCRDISRCTSGELVIREPRGGGGHTDWSADRIGHTRVQPPHEARSTYREGTLKAVVISPQFAVCFAGDMGAGLAGVRDAARRAAAGARAEEIVEGLQRAATAAPHHIEFLLAVCGGDWQLAKIDRNGAAQPPSLAWVGDPEGFEAFTYRIDLELMFAMNAVIPTGSARAGTVITLRCPPQDPPSTERAQAESAQGTSEDLAETANA